MKSLHNKDHFALSLGHFSLTNSLMAFKLRILSTHTHTNIEIRKQFNWFSIRAIIFCFLMLSAIGLLNSQTAGSPCGCISFNPVGIRGQKVPISTVVGGVTNCTLIRGILVINQPTTWNQLSIRMEAGSGIEVRSSLIIDESNIGTCDTLWSGIYALGGDTCWISVDRSVVSGANIAIELRDEASYAIQRTQFINNFIGISTGNPFTAPASDIEVYAGDYPILGCEFATNGQLPTPYFSHYYYPAWPSNPAIPFNQGYAALYISGSIGLNLGELAPTFPERNRIHHMRNGVIVNNATTRILGSDFYNFVGSVPKFAAYNEELNFNQRAISAAGSTCHIEHDSMYNLMIGIHSTRSSQDIIDNYLNIRVSSPIPATRGVDISQPVRSYVSENDIYNGFMGISVNGSSGSLLIEYNNLFRSLTVENNVGINLQTLFNGLRPNTVQENVLEITGAQKAVGISMNTISDLLVYHNIIDFFDTDLLPAGVENAGISGMQVYNSLISENFVTGTLDYQTELDNSGIIMTNNMANDLNCNTTDSTFYGHWYIGNNMGTDLKSNEFYNAHHGLE